MAHHLSSVEIKALLTHVSEASLYYPQYRYKVWGYGEWIALEGLLAASEIAGNPHAQGFVEGLVGGWVSKREQLIPADHVAPGVALIRLHQLTGQDVYLDRALALARLLLDSPRCSRGARLLRPDANTHVYVDCLYSDPTLFCQLGLATGETHWFAEAVRYTREFWDALVDDTLPLLYHGYSDTTRQHIGLLWGRGVGWALLGLVDELAALPENTPGREGILQNLQSMAAALQSLQASNGHWHTVLTHPETYLENSIAAFVHAAFRKARRCGLLDEAYEPCIQKAWEAVLGAIQPNGQILVSEATPEGDLASYQALRLGVYPWGQGPVMRALVEELAARGALRE
ncbi:MAG: glycoside hydrolase family 88 protein [Acidobacteriota bacterium]